MKAIRSKSVLIKRKFLAARGERTQAHPESIGTLQGVPIPLAASYQIIVDSQGY